MKDIITIGSTTRDVFLETDFDLEKSAKTPSGKALVIPLGEKFNSKKAYFTVGGNASNASFTFARQGFKTGIFTKIGKDADAVEIRRAWKRDKIDARLAGTSELPTSYSVLLLQGGERSIIRYHGAIDEFRVREGDLKKLKSRWWYMSLSGESYKELPKLLRFARANGIKVALNPSYKLLEGNGREMLIRNLKNIAFLAVNEGEAAKITGVPFYKEKEVFAKLDELVPGIVAITSGAKGVSVSDGMHIYKAGTFKNKKIVDRTGAGDAFGSGFVAGLMHTKEDCVKGVCEPTNVEYAIRLASANATSVVEHIGGVGGVLTKKQLDAATRFKKLPVRIKRV